MECFRVDESGYTAFDLINLEQRFQVVFTRRRLLAGWVIRERLQWVGSYLSPAAEIGQKQSFGDEDIGHCVL